MKLTNVKAVARKEYYHLIRDVRSLFLAFFIPLFLIFIFGYALSLDVNNIRTVVLDHDRTDLSRDLTRQLDASEYFDVIGQVSSERDVTAYLDDGRAMLAITIPPRWSQDMRADREAPIQVLFDGSNANSAAIARAYVTAFMEVYNRKAFIRFVERQGLAPVRPAIDARMRIWFNEDLESRNLVVPGEIAVIIMIAGAMLTSLVIAREFENGTMETLLSPAAHWYGAPGRQGDSLFFHRIDRYTGCRAHGTGALRNCHEIELLVDAARFVALPPGRHHPGFLYFYRNKVPAGRQSDRRSGDISAIAAHL